MIIGISSGLIFLAIIVAGIGVFGFFTGNSTEDDRMINIFFLFAIFLLLLAAVIKYIW